MTGSVACNSTYLGFEQDQLAFGDIPAGGFGACLAPIVMHVTRDIPDLTHLRLEVSLSEEPGFLPISFDVRAPSYLVSILAIDDGFGGNGIADPGETVALTLSIGNNGGAASPVANANLGSASDYFLPLGDPEPIDPIVPGGEVILANWSVEISPSCPPVFSHHLRILLEGAQHYVAALPFVFTVGEIFADNLEAGSASWTHTAGVGSWIDEWHLEMYRNHTYGGEMCWKCGGAGATGYANLCYAILETAEFDLPPGGQLTFWHWISAETSAAYPEYCYDGGLLEISTDGGATWDPLIPAGGYPYLTRAGAIAGPFPAETPVWSGQHDWKREEIDLSSYSGAVKIHWIFGSDGAEVAEGWYLDDVHISIPPTTGAPEPERLTVALRPVSANPLQGTAQFHLALARSGQVEASVHDISGRRIRLLLERELAAGEHRFAWDGRDRLGRPVHSGTYWIRVVGPDADLKERVLVVR